MKDKHKGSNFDDFLREEGIYDEVVAKAQERAKAGLIGVHWTIAIGVANELKYWLVLPKWESTEYMWRFRWLFFMVQGTGEPF
jgi:hypothetical protein